MLMMGASPGISSLLKRHVSGHGPPLLQADERGPGQGVSFLRMQMARVPSRGRPNGPTVMTNRKRRDNDLVSFREQGVRQETLIVVLTRIIFFSEHIDNIAGYAEAQQLQAERNKQMRQCIPQMGIMMVPRRSNEIGTSG